MLVASARACGVPSVATLTTGHSAGHCEGAAVVKITQPDTLAPIDDGPGAKAPPVYDVDIASAISKARAQWLKLSKIAEFNAPGFADKWSWDQQLAPLLEQLR